MKSLNLRKIIDYLFYIFIFLLPWQTKLVLRSAESNYNEISLYLSHIILILLLAFFIINEIKTKHFKGVISWLWYMLAGFELFAFISIFFASDPWLGFYRYLVLLLGFGIFYILRNKVKKRSYDQIGFDKVIVITVFLVTVFLHALLGLYQFLAQHSFSFKFLGIASHNPEMLGVSVIETISGRWLRAYGGLDHPNILGGVLVIALILAAYLLAKKKILNNRRQIQESLCLFIFYFISLFALFFTFSRSAWLALAAGLFVLLVFFIIKGDRWITGRLIALIIFSAILISAAAIPYYDLVETRIKAQGRLEQNSITERQSDYFQARQVLTDNLGFGVGLGNYVQTLSERDKNQQPSWYYQPVHNSFLLLLIETGFFAFFFFISFLSYLIIRKKLREEFAWSIFIALIILMILDHWLISLPFGTVFLFFVLGLI